MANDARPFYIIGHNPNTIDLVQTFLKGGANAIEPDVSVWDPDGDGGELCISHGKGTAGAPTVVDFFKQLNQLTKKFPNFSIVYLDIKPEAAVPAHAQELLGAVRQYLLGSGLRVIYSVAEYADAKRFFPALAQAMEKDRGQRDEEGVMIDYERDADKVSTLLGSYGFRNHCFGFGNSAPFAPPHVGDTMTSACQCRDKSGSKMKLVVAWTFDFEFSQENRLNEGVDGIVVDTGKGLQNIKELIADKTYNRRIATRKDNPFRR
jgi:hypothetical protein